MPKYRVELGSFCSRLVTRHIVVSAKSEEEAIEKAKIQYDKAESRVPSSVGSGDIQVDECVIIGGES